MSDRSFWRLFAQTLACCFGSYLRTARTGGFVGSAQVWRVCQRGYANVSCGWLENALKVSAGRLLCTYIGCFKGGAIGVVASKKNGEGMLADNIEIE